MLEEFRKITKEIRKNELVLFSHLDEVKQSEWLVKKKEQLDAIKTAASITGLLRTLESMSQCNMQD